MINAAAFRRVCHKTCSSILAPAGFREVRPIRGQTLWVRKSGAQIQSMNVQASSRSGEFTINLGFHFADTPTRIGDRVAAPDEMWVPDYLFQSRLGILHEGIDVWWPYGENAEEGAAKVTNLCQESLKILDQIDARFPSPDSFAEIVAPEDILQLAPAYGSHEVRVPPERILKELPRWQIDAFGLSLFMCLAAKRAGNLALAQRFAEAGLNLQGYHGVQRAKLQQMLHSGSVGHDTSAS